MRKTRKKWCAPLGVGLLLCSVICLGSLSQAKDEEAESVEIVIDTEGYDIYSLPNGIAGKTYPVFECTAKDNLGNPVDNIETMVFYDPQNNTDKGITSDDKVLAINNGRFKTMKAGTYVIEYVANSGVAQTVEKIFVYVLSADSYEAPQYQINPEIKSKTNTGTILYFPDGVLKSDKRFGNTTVETVLRYDGKYSCENTEISGGEEQVKSFKPTVSGTYELCYVITDILGEAASTVYVKKIQVVDSKAPIIETPVRFRLLHVGEETIFPATEAILYYEGKAVYVPVKVSVGTTDITETMAYTPKKAGKTTVTYVAENIFNSGTKTTVSYPVSVYELEKNSKTPIIDKYMYLDGFKGAYRKEAAEGLETELYTLTAGGKSSQASMYLKSKINVASLELKFGAETTMSQFGSISVNLVDSQNSSEKLELQFVENVQLDKAIIDVYCNKTWVTSLDKRFTGGADANALSQIELIYDVTRNAFVDEQGTVIFTPSAYNDGSVFRGFSSKQVYVSLQMNAITGPSQLKLYSIGNCIITNDTKDISKPYVIQPKGYSTTQRIDKGMKATIKKIDAFDLFSGNTSVTLKITAPDGTSVYDDVMTEDYSLLVDKYGNYNVVYEVSDDANNRKRVLAIVTVIDRIAPEITVEKPKLKVKVGEEITLPKITAKDDCTEQCQVWTYVSYGNYQKKLLVEKTYTFEEAGTYVLKCGAEDEAGNYSLAEYTIVCE